MILLGGEARGFHGGAQLVVGHGDVPLRGLDRGVAAPPAGEQIAVGGSDQQGEVVALPVPRSPLSALDNADIWHRRVPIVLGE